MSSLTYCDVYIVRHGQTQWNVDRRLQGEMDIPLNEKGIEQAKQLHDRFSGIKFQAAYSSDLSRAHETAAIILNSKDIPIIKTSQLRETKLGCWVGKPIDELKTWITAQSITNHGFQKDEYFKHKWHDEVESVGEVFHRSIHYILNLSTSHLGQTVIVVSHGGVLESIMNHLEFDPTQRWKATNCGWMKLRIFADHHFELIEKDGIYPSSETAIV